MSYIGKKNVDILLAYMYIDNGLKIMNSVTDETVINSIANIKENLTKAKNQLEEYIVK